MDTSILLWVHNTIPTAGFYTGFFEIVTKLGSSWIVLLIGIIATFIYTSSGKFNKAHMVLLSAIFVAIGSSLIKNIIDRPRPDLFSPLISVDGFSMPSGHAMISVAIYGILAYFFCETRPQKKKITYIFTGILIFLIGLSRIYLGVHWPTDVIVGWMLGGLVLYMMIWWYRHGGINRTIRIIIGIMALFFGLIGIIFPLIPGIPLIIAGILLIFSSKTTGEMWGSLKRRLTPTPPSQ